MSADCGSHDGTLGGVANLDLPTQINPRKDKD
jgi:hypothetical protein